MWKRTYFWILSTLVFFPFPAHRCYFFLPACICRTGLAFPKHENAVTKGITRACNEDQSSALVSEIRGFFPYRFIRKPWAHGHFSAVTLNSPLDSAAFPTIISPFALYYHPDTFPYFLVSCFPYHMICSAPHRFHPRRSRHYCFSLEILHFSATSGFAKVIVFFTPVNLFFCLQLYYSERVSSCQ